MLIVVNGWGKTTNTYTVKIQILMKMKNAKLCYVRSARKVRVVEDLLMNINRLDV